MHYRIFSLLPNIFNSFWSNSLIARGLSKSIISQEIINWRDNYGIGNYKQVDDKPFGGGTGMVLMPEPIFRALKDYNAVSSLFQTPNKPQICTANLPNNSKFFNYWQNNPEEVKKVTISLTPRGFPINQEIVEWLSQNFTTMNILCGRFEGFDQRVSKIVDLELSLGNFVLNGGEVASMALVESTARLLPSFVSKSESVAHDSFSSSLNYYSEQEEFVIGKKRLLQKPSLKVSKPFLKANLKNKTDTFTVQELKINNKIDSLDLLDFDEFLPFKQTDLKTKIPESKQSMFDDLLWQTKIRPFIEHPQYTRPSSWQNLQVPTALLSGNHKEIQYWRQNWW